MHVLTFDDLEKMTPLEAALTDRLERLEEEIINLYHELHELRKEGSRGDHHIR